MELGERTREVVLDDLQSGELEAEPTLDPHGEALAQRMMWALTYLHEEAARIQAETDRSIALIQERHGDLVAGVNRQISDLEQRLMQWHRATMDATDGKKKTIKMHAGTLTARKATAKVAIEDQGRLIDALRAKGQGDLVEEEVVVKVPLAGLKKFMQAQGLDSIDGARLVTGETSYSVKVGQ